MYVFDEEIIHDRDTIWLLALDFKVFIRYGLKNWEKSKRVITV